MSTMTEIQTTQVYQVFIQATPEQIWDAITKPEFTEKYFYGARIENTPEAHRSLGPDGSTWGDSRTVEFDPPRRLVHGWRSLYDPELAHEDESRVTWEIEPQDGGVSLLTVVHDRLEGQCVRRGRQRARHRRQRSRRGRRERLRHERARRV